MMRGISKKFVGVECFALILLLSFCCSSADAQSGRVFAWGQNSYGQATVPSAALQGVKSISGGEAHSLALRAQGEVIPWGSNLYGQANIPPATNFSIAAISAGFRHGLALKENGTIFDWGNYNRTAFPHGLTNVAAIAAGNNFGLALQDDGLVIGWGHSVGLQTSTNGLSNVVAIAAGGIHCLALKEEGTVVAWGNNLYGQATVPAGLVSVVAVEAGAFNSMALRSNGTVVVWGRTTYGLQNIPAEATNIVQIALGATHCLALRDDGKLIAWGDNTFGQLNIPPGLTNIIAIAAGEYHSLALMDESLLTIVTQPVSVTVTNGATVTFTVDAVGAQPLYYQWQRDGADLIGATNAQLSLTNVHYGHEGSYRVVVSNDGQMVVSSDALLDVWDIGEALNAPTLVWNHAGSAPWLPQTFNTYDGIAAVVVNAAGGQSMNYLHTMVSGPGTLSFSMQAGIFSMVYFYVNGLNRWSSPSTSSWQQRTFYLPEGDHLLTWAASGSGPAYLDTVSYVPGATAATVAGSPVGRIEGEGNSFTFTVSAIGTPPLSYQWQFNGGNIFGATNSSYGLTNVQASQAGEYRVLVSNLYGSDTSAHASLVITSAPPTILTHPVSMDIIAGKSLSLVAAAKGTSPLFYQWRRNGVEVVGATDSQLTISSISLADGGQYSLFISNSVGTATSSNALVQIYEIGDVVSSIYNGSDLLWSAEGSSFWFSQTNTTLDGIAAQSGAIANNQQSILEAVFEGPAKISFWWKVSCHSLRSRLAFAVNGTVQTNIAGNVDWQRKSYWVGAGTQTVRWIMMRDSTGGSATDKGWLDGVEVTFGGEAPVFATQPLDRTVNAGNNVFFNPVVEGTVPLLYQWKFNGADIPGETNASFWVWNAQAHHNGIYSVVVSNDYGSAVSSNAVLTVNPRAPVIVTQPASQTKAINGTATFSVLARGTEPLHYYWYFNENLISASGEASLTLDQLQQGDAGNYHVVVSNDLGSVTSEAAALEVAPTAIAELWRWPPDSFVTNPPVPPGLHDTIAVAAGTSHSLALRSNGVVVAWGDNRYGQTNVPLGLTNVIGIAAGAYHSLALKEDGTVVGWGNNEGGQLFQPLGVSNVIELASFDSYNLALRSDGTVIGWGYNGDGQINVPSGLSNVVSIAAGRFNAYALKNDGSVVVWGSAQYAVTPPSSLNNVVALAAGSFVASALLSDGSVQTWGNFAEEFPANYARDIAIASDRTREGFLFVKPDGSLEIFRGSFSADAAVNLKNIVSVSAGYEHAIILMNDGSPVVNRRMVNQTVATGAQVVFSAGVIGAEPLQYQWQFNGVDIDGATDALLILSNVSPAAAGDYRCVVSNSLGSVTTSSATLNVIRSTLFFDPASSWINDNGEFCFTLNGLSGHGNVVIYGSTDLVNWEPVYTNSPHTGPLLIVDPNPSERPAVFYRAEEE